MGKRSQCQQIVGYMKTFGGITSNDAIRTFGCTRLASRIHDLREHGYEISREMVDVETRYGSKARVARYSLIKEPS